MKHLFKTLIVGSLLSFALSLGVGAALYNPQGLNATTTVYGTYGTNGGPVDVSTYYSGISSSATGDTLGSALHELMMSTHAYYTTYGEIRYLFEYTDDYGQSTEGYVTNYYVRSSINGVWPTSGTADISREHVWCASWSNNLWSSRSSSARGGEGDLYHIRPVASTNNGGRSNKQFADRTSTSTTWYSDHLSDAGAYYSGTYNGTGGYWEPQDSRKGDVARELMYLYMHYSTGFGGTTNSYTGDLPITNIFHTDSGTAAAAWAQLVTWNDNDQPDAWEQHLNNVASSYSGNRNPFIDHPEYADRIWSSVSFSMPSTATVSVGGTVSVAGTVSGGTASSLTYSVSSGSSYATVNSATGLVTGSAAGTAVITGTAVIDGTTYTDTTTVSVTSNAITGVTVSPTTLEIAVGSAGTLSATVSPSSASQTVAWSSNATGVATVSSSGVVTGMSAGTATITATAGSYTATCTVTVTAAGGGSGSYVLVTSASDLVAGSHYVIGGGQNASATASTIKFQSNTNNTGSQINLASNSVANNQVTPTSTTGILTLSSVSTGVYGFQITNYGSSGSYYLNTSTNTSSSTYTLRYSTTATTSTASQWGISINSSTYVATITSQVASKTNKYVNYSGTAFRLYTSANVYLYKESVVNVPVTGVTVAPTSLSLMKDATSQLTATVSPSNATNKSVSWTTSNSAVATVSSTGLVTAVGQGSCTITVTTISGGFTATCAVTVNALSSITTTAAPACTFGEPAYLPTKDASFVVTAHYSDGSTKDVTSSATYTNISDFRSSSTAKYNFVLGMHNLTVSYTESAITKTIGVAVRTTNVGAVRVSGSGVSASYSDALTSNPLVDSASGVELNASSSVPTSFKLTSLASDIPTGSSYYPCLGSANTGAWDVVVTPLTATSGYYTTWDSTNGWHIGSNNYQVTETVITSETTFGSISTVTISAKANTSGGHLYAYYSDGTNETLIPYSATVDYIDLTSTITAYTWTLASAVSNKKIVFKFEEKASGTATVFYLLNLGYSSSGTVENFTYQQQAEATRDFIQQYLTCSISETNLRQCVIEYNAMNVDDAGTNSKTIFATLLTTVNQYNYGSDDSFDYNQQTGEYTGNGPSGSTILVLTKLTYMTARYNTGKTDANKYYLYSDAYYANTDGNGSGTKVAPLLVDSAGRIINPTSAQSSLSITLIVVASTGVMTLLLIAGIYVFSRKKRKQI
jgi:uncharacterized protein YjdB